MLMESFSGSARILLIRDLELFSISAANLLLKAIEESRGDSYYILTSNNINRIPNTVRSRCQCYNFSPLDPEALTTICSTLMNTQELKSKEIESLEWAISGTVTGALQSIKNKAELEKIRSLFDELESGSTTAAFKLANIVHEQKQDNKYLVRAMIELTHQRLIQSHLKSRPWALLLENLQTAERLINERHLNSQYVLANIFISFSQQVTCRNSTTETEKCLNDIIQDAI
jgi:DNA polymerase III delta prime subunit